MQKPSMYSIGADGVTYQEKIVLPRPEELKDKAIAKVEAINQALRKSVSHTSDQAKPARTGALKRGIAKINAIRESLSEKPPPALSLAASF